MSNIEMKNALISVLEKIKENSIYAWEDDLKDTKNVVVMDDFNKGVDESDIVKYNGWFEDLELLTKALTKKQ